MDNQKEKDLEYCREIYKTSASSCLNEAVSKHLWLTDRLNATSEQFTERLFWFAGISLGILPFAIEKFSISNSSNTYLLILSTILLIVSMLIGIIDHFLIESFYKQDNRRAIKRIKNWRPVYAKLQNIWLNPLEVINCLEKAESFDRGLYTNAPIRSAEWPAITQTILVLLGFALEIIYILIQLV